MNTLENPTKNQPDARLDASAALIFQALDPAQNVVVEACAGSGKTWLLASRIVRLLLAGVAPGEILAITFTRKAAREIEERVLGWLHFLATSDSARKSWRIICTPSRSWRRRKKTRCLLSIKSIEPMRLRSLNAVFRVGY